MSTPGMRQFAPATQRNREPILAVLRQVLPTSGTVLEVASGTGEHAVYFSQHLPHLNWLPSDPNPVARASIAAWRGESGVSTLHSPIALDASQMRWPVEPLDELATGHIPVTAGAEEAIEISRPITAIVNINTIHISPWEVCLGLLAGAGRILTASGVLYLYGPYRRDGRHTATSNAAFDLSLRSQNPEWGVRHLEDVVAAAKAQGLSLENVIAMPANNFSVVFHKL